MKPLDQLKTISHQPGVYLMFDDKHRVLYVGKAKDLKKRVASYFAKSQGSPSTSRLSHPEEGGKTRALVERIHHIETIVVAKEIEALILENELIKKYRPPFNVLMRDDKNYLYIRVGIADAFPTITFVRQSSKDGAKYFGPFVDSRSARKTIQLLQRILPLCTATPKSLKSGGQAKKIGRPCLNYHIGRCLGVCTGNITVATYREIFQQVVDFLNGKYAQVLKDLEAEMHRASAAKRFEQAGRLRDGILAIKKLAETQSVVSPSLKEDIDVIGMDTKANRSVITMMRVRGGKILQQMPFVMESKYESQSDEVLAGFLRDYYGGLDATPHLILLSESPRDVRVLEKWLGTLGKHQVKIVIPTRGLKKRLLTIANANAAAKFEEVAKRLKLETKFATEGLAELKTKLNLKRIERIEAFDISHTGGQDAVGAMVVFEKGRLDNQQYRRFKIKSNVGADDYASLSEVLRRRFMHREKTSRFAQQPDLVMIDGGKGQVSVVAKALGNFEFKLIGMAKGDHSAPKAKDEVIVYRLSQPLNLAKNSPAKYLLQQIRDEVHRFAISYHTNLKRKQVRESALEQVSGVGPVTRKKLIKKFGSMAGVKSASEAEIAEVVGNKKAKELKNKL